LAATEDQLIKMLDELGICTLHHPEINGMTVRLYRNGGPYGTLDGFGYEGADFREALDKLLERKGTQLPPELVHTASVFLEL
jgi:hypothetical protein